MNPPIEMRCCKALVTVLSPDAVRVTFKFWERTNCHTKCVGKQRSESEDCKEMFAVSWTLDPALRHGWLVSTVR